MKHTPGPWFAHDFSGINGEETSPSDIAISCTTPDHITVATMGVGITGKREEWEANARLIAASPDLLLMLERLADHYQYQVGMDKMYELAMSYVAKARGEDATT